MYSGVPTAIPSCVRCSESPSSGAASRARPKSVIFTVPPRVSRMFSGLMSRCTMPASSAACRASATCRRMFTAVAASGGPFFLRYSRSVGPGTYSWAM